MHEEYLKHVNMNVTEDIKKFVKDGVFGDSEYLFVDNVNIGYCSYCKHEYEVSNVKHNEKGICPVCSAQLKVKLSRYGRKNCMNEACFYYFEKSIIDPNVIVCKGYYVKKSYGADYKNPKIEYELIAFYIFEDKKATMLKYGYWPGWSVKGSIFDFNQGWLAPKMCYCSFESIENAVQGTSYQYIPYKMFQGYYSIVKLFSEYSKYPWIEQLSKIGFANIIKAKLTGDHIYSCLNYKGKDIFKILKLSRSDVKEIRKYPEWITPLFLRLYQLQVKDKSGLSPAQVKDIEEKRMYSYAHISNILKYTTMKKMMKYIDKQYEKYNNRFHYNGEVMITWNDYIDDCIKLEMNLKSEQVLFPRNLYTAHQNTINQVLIKGNKVYDEKIDRRLDSLQKYSFKYKDLIIRAASSSIELINEGKALTHCVGGYAGRYAKGETDILFIRKVSEIDKPYYTVEVRDDLIIQVHGKNNRSANEDVKEFIEAFKEEILNKKQVKNRVKISA